MIFVTPMSRLTETVQRSGASHLVTLLTAGSTFVLPEEIDRKNHLHLTMHDIAAPREGMTPPDAGHIGALLEFAGNWDRSAPLVINCFAGISRSTAAAYAVCCALRPDRDETETAMALRRLSPSATPNPLIVSLADDMLDRQGRMIQAIASIGRGADAYEGEPFGLEI